jgi:hypothetical protein
MFQQGDSHGAENSWHEECSHRRRLGNCEEQHRNVMLSLIRVEMGWSHMKSG